MSHNYQSTQQRRTHITQHTMSDDEHMDVVVEEEVDEDDDPTFGPHSMGLNRVEKGGGKRSRNKNQSTLNARGMPARLRKKKNFYDDEDDEGSMGGGSGSKSLITPSKRGRRSGGRMSDDEDQEFVLRRVKRERGDTEDEVLNFDTMSENEIQVTEQVGRRLKNLLKLPKAHKFVMFEWFYSNLDQVLFKGENDFQLCLRESFPQLAARQMTRIEWSMIRRMMGNPLFA